MNQQYLLTLVAPPALEESLVDWLLEIAAEHGFGSAAMYGHSGRHEGLTLAEQVSGRRKQIRFEMHLPAAEVEPLLEKLRRDYAGTGIHYWTVPVAGTGRV